MKLVRLLPTAVLAASDKWLGINSLGPRYIFSFGDSFTSTAFDVNGIQPSSSSPLGNTDVGYGMTSAGGPVWINYVTTKYNLTYIETYNLAVGGATIPGNYTYQIESLYPKYVSGSDPGHFWTAKETLHTSWIGINDIVDMWSPGADFDAIARERLGAYRERMETIYASGARNFLFVNTPPLDRSPFVANWGGQERYDMCVNLYNNGLYFTVEAFRTAHPDANIKLYDVHTFFGHILDNAQQYGFKDSTCANTFAHPDSECLWAGDFHVGSPIHKLIAEDMMDTLKTFVF